MKKQITISVLSVFFLITTFLVITNNTVSIDSAVYNFVMFINHDVTTYILIAISFLVSTFMCVLYCLIALIVFKNKYKALFLSASLIIQALINNILKIIIARPRPIVNQMVYEKSYSYPSGHTMAVTMLILVLGYFIKEKYQNKKTFITFIQVILIFLVGLSRIYLGVHYFSDIIGGVILSSIIYLLINNKKFKKFINKGV